MSGAFVLLHIAGAVALLVWATRMVRTGVDRAHGALLRRFLGRAAATRAGAAAAGAALAVGFQGSTAVALLVTGTIASGLISPSIGLAVVLGADFGSALVVQILSFDLSFLIPLLLVCGVFTFLAGNRRSIRQAGRIVVGIALILVALKMLGEATAPLRESGQLGLWTGYLAGDPLTAMLLAAVLTWIMHSSVAAVLLIVSLAAHGLVGLPLAAALVLGANLGGGAIALVLTRTADRHARAVPFANFVLRALIAVVGLVLLRTVGLPDVAALPAGQAVALMHVMLNLVLVVVSIPVTDSVSRIAGRWLSGFGRQRPEDVRQVRATSLDPAMVAQPRQAIAAALREILNMSDTVAAMLQGIIDLFESGDRDRIDRLAARDDEVDAQCTRIKLYLADVGRHATGADETRRCNELTTFCIRLEQAGDIVAKNLLSLATKKSRLQVEFSADGWHELCDLHKSVSTNLQLALNVLVSGDRESARELLEEKQRTRLLERTTTDRHMERLRSGTVKSVESSEIHLDAVRDLVQINALLASVAYPILEQSGDLRESRLIPAE